MAFFLRSSNSSLEMTESETRLGTIGVDITIEHPECFRVWLCDELPAAGGARREVLLQFKWKDWVDVEDDDEEKEEWGEETTQDMVNMYLVDKTGSGPRPRDNDEYDE
jgi:hypothetical protein